MKAIDSKGRLFGVVNILDVIVLVLITGAAAGFAARLADRETVSLLGGNDIFYVTFRVERVRGFSVDAVNVGDIIYEQHAAKLGEVVKVETGVPREIITLNDGTAAYFPMEDRYDLYITIKATGTVNSSGYYVGGNNQLAAGKDIRLQSSMIFTSARVYSVSETLV